MSYCRWSSMNWKCDVYVYADASGGWTTHVASRKRIFSPIPDVLTNKLGYKIAVWSDGKWNKETRKFEYSSVFKKLATRLYFGFCAWWHTYLHMGSLRLIPLKPIGLPFDGETFNDSTPQDCANRLKHLRSIGYCVPDYAIHTLEKEPNENN